MLVNDGRLYLEALFLPKRARADKDGLTPHCRNAGGRYNSKLLNQVLVVLL